MGTGPPPHPLAVEYNPPLASSVLSTHRRHYDVCLLVSLVPVTTSAGACSSRPVPASSQAHCSHCTGLPAAGWRWGSADAPLPGTAGLGGGHMMQVKALVVLRQSATSQ